METKELVIKDICCRLPYGVKVKTKGDPEIYTLLNVHPNKDIALIGLLFVDVYATAKIKIEDCKPYLRPMSSMTEEEKKEYQSLCEIHTDRDVDDIVTYYYFDTIESFDWLNKKMFDYRGLIPKGFANSTEEFNPYKD